MVTKVFMLGQHVQIKDNGKILCGTISECLPNNQYNIEIPFIDMASWTIKKNGRFIVIDSDFYETSERPF